MNCPVCDIEMKNISIKNVSLDYCDMCQGIWCDKDELEKIAMSGKDFLKTSPIAKSLEKNINNIRSQKNSSLKCPCCDASLEKFNYSYESDIILEICKICNGIWVDDGEFGDIIEYIYNNE